MAWRIHHNVVRGEIDNREKGRVRGHLWLHGRDEPVELDLEGNAHPDLAGCLLAFRNTGQTWSLHQGDDFKPLQKGAIGDLTASRKVRVFDVPVEQALDMSERGEKPPEHLANCLYLEWFSEGNGRVVVESTDFQLDISAPAWRLTPEEDAQRARQAAAGFAGFLEKLSRAVETARHHPPEDKEWDEFDYELMMRESDAVTDKYIELLEKYGDNPEADETIAREMGWLDDEEDDAAGGGNALEVDELDDAADEDAGPLEPNPLTEGVDWIRTGDDDIRHPLQHRCYEAAMKLRHECDDLGGLNENDDDLCELITEYQITSAKLAGALNGLAYDRDLREGAFIVACLKRALGHLHQAQAALEKVVLNKSLPAPIACRVRGELFSIREDMLRLMDEFRGRKQE
jgi:pterin-4a-carbinolamine dehydratase